MIFVILLYGQCLHLFPPCLKYNLWHLIWRHGVHECWLYVLHISLVNTFVKMNVIKLHCMRSLCRQLSTSCGVFSYKSAICLENIYPKSNLSITTATEVCFMFFVMWMMKHKCECNSVMKEACETMITVFSFHWRSRMCYKLNQTQQ